MDLTAIIEHIKQQQWGQGQDQVHVNKVIYLGIGTAAGYREPDNTLADKNYHQFPPFLQHLQNSTANVNLAIILIDPLQENPPYMVADKGLVQSNRNRDLNNTDNNYIYCSRSANLTLYTLREEVYTDPYLNNQRGLNITSHLRALNTYAIDNNIIFLYHDFTGRNIRTLAEFFDDELKAHLSHVIYGLGLREDTGCYFDLTHACSYYPSAVDQNGVLKLFNLYDYIVNEKLDCLQEDINRKFINHNTNTNTNTNNNHNGHLFNEHLEKMTSLVKHEVVQVMLQALRAVFRLITGEEVKEFDAGGLDFPFISGQKREMCLQLFNDNKYGDLYEYLMTFFGKKLDIVAYVKGLDLTGREMLEFITLGDDPFSWYNNVRHFF
jgi:hypothetical protein